MRPTHSRAKSTTRASGCRLVAISAAVAGLALLAAGTAHALGLGEIVEQSSLGEPFRVAIPVLFNADDLTADELAPECFRLVTGESSRSSELPQIAFGRATLERNAGGARVVVTSNHVANDPAVGITVQAGCKLRIRHEYTVLLDPPVVREAVADTAARADVTAPSLQRAASSNSVAPRTRAAAKANGAAAAKSTIGHSAASAAAPKRGSKPARLAVKAGAPTRPAPASAKDETPRLRVSRSAQGPSGEQSATDIAHGKSDEEIRREVEAETVVLQRRVAELSATLELMQEQLIDAQAARDAAERSVKAAPQPSEPSPWLIAALLTVAVFLIALTLWRSRRTAPLIDLGPSTVIDAPSFGLDVERAQQPEPATAIASAGAATPFGAASVRPHRESAPRQAISLVPSPAAEADFEEDLLRYAEQTSTHTVLEREQPRVVASVVRDWGKPRVIAYLRELLVNPRRNGRPFSREAVSDLMFLQALAMERAGYRPDDNPWQVELGNRWYG